MAYEEITLEDMERFLKRGYRVLRPKKGASRGELYYDLNLSDEKILIRVWTSIHPQTGVSAQSGSDAIRVTLLTRSGRPLMPKSTIVKRTGRWKATLQERIDDYIELYEAKTDYWKGRQQQKDGDAPAEAPAEIKPPSESGESFEGAYRKLQKDPSDWGVVIWTRGSEGDEGVARTKGGQPKKVRLIQMDWSGKDPWPPHRGEYCEIWRFEDVSGKGGTGRFASGAPPFDLVVNSVVERYMNRSVV